MTDIHQAHLWLISWVKTTDSGELKEFDQKAAKLTEAYAKGFQTLQASVVASLSPVAFSAAGSSRIPQMCDAKASNSHKYQEQHRRIQK